MCLADIGLVVWRICAGSYWRGDSSKYADLSEIPKAFGTSGSIDSRATIAHSHMKVVLPSCPPGARAALPENVMRHTLPATAILLGLALLSGCAHTHLRWNTTHQAETLSDIYEQQVLDNLARFVHDPNALPSFAYPNQGGTDVSDQGSLGSDTTWNRLGFSSELLKVGGSRNMKEAWTMTPVYDVRRLELMRCAYQQALSSAGLCTNDPECPNCDKLQRAFYIGDPNGQYAPEKNHLGTFTAKTGRTTPACFSARPWLVCGDRKSITGGCHCRKSGHYCGTYVSVLPGGQDELTKLTLTILDYAFSPQAIKPPKPVKEVTWYFDKNGLPTERVNAAQEMKAVVPFDAKVRLAPPGDGLELPFDKLNEEQRKKRLKEIDKMFEELKPAEPSLPLILPPPSGLFPLQFELNRQFLTPQSSAPQP